MSKARFLMASLSLLAVASTVQADTVIGNFEGAAEAGWGEWSGGVGPFPSYMSVSNEAATLGSSSMKIEKAGYDQNLAYSAGTAGTIPSFVANDKLLFDVVFPATTTGGYAQIFELALNSPAGFVGVNYSGDSAGWGPTGGAAIVKTFEYDYRSLKAAMGPTPGWVELIFATNSDAAHGVFYIDNVRLVTVPEPATALAALAAGTLLRRRR